MQADHNVSTEFQRVSELGRWGARGGRPSMSPGCRSANAIANKRKAKLQIVGAGDRAQHVLTTATGVDLSRCASGHELVTAFRNGSAFGMPLRKLTKGVTLPTEELQKRMTRATWKLRGARLELAGWVAYAMVVCKLEGLCATYAELAILCELADPSWVAELMHDLRAWGLVAADHTWVKHGKASSQRAHVYRLTNVGAHVFGLDLLLDTARLPAPEPDTTPRIARARAGAHGSGKTHSHPESTPDQKPASREAPSSDRPYEAPSIDGPCAAPASVDVRLPSALPDESACLPSLEGVKTRPAALSTGLIKPVIPRTTAGELGSLVDCVLPHDPHSGSRATPRRQEGLLRHQERRQHEQDERRRNELREQLEQRERERRQAERDRAVEPAPDDSWAAVAAAALAEERAAELARYRAELEQTPRLNKPRRPDPDAERLDMLETLERSNKLRGLPLPAPLELELAELRRRRS